VNRASDLLLLLLNLAQMRSRSKVVDLFIGSLSSLFPNHVASFAPAGSDTSAGVFAVTTRNSRYGGIVVAGPDPLSAEDRGLLHNAAQMLAVILERLEFEDELEQARSGAEKLAERRLRRLQATVEQLQQSRDAYVNLVEDLTRENTERQRAEEALRESQARFSAAFHSATVAQSISTLDWRFVEVNQALCQLVGYSPTELQGRTPAELGISSDLTAVGLEPALQRQSVIRLELDLRSRDGVEHRVLTSVQRIDLQGVPHYLSVSMDITDQKAMAAELDHQRVLATQVDRLRALGEMATGVAHELNQPLNGIRTFAEGTLIGLRRHWHLAPGDLEATLEDIITQVDRMSEIIGHMRVFARDPSDQAPSRFQVGESLAGALKLIGSQLRVHGFAVDQRVRENLPECEGWPNQIEQVILNLLANSRDALDSRIRRQRRGDEATDTGWRPHLAVAIEPVPGFVRLAVTDNGGGIADTILERIFDPFFTTKEVGAGTGLGLALARAAVERHHGRIEVDNHPGEGVTFAVLLPAARPPADAAAPRL
jgi:PAS domain S-box-containing protein